jgi:hypothetical protein
VKTFPELVSIVFVLLPAIVVHGQEQKFPNSIDPVIIAGYEKRGGTYGGLKPTYDWKEEMESGFGFTAGHAGAQKGLAGFRFQTNPKAKLPDISFPFGLTFANSPWVTDAGLTELAELKHLSILNLSFTPITDEGL